MAARGIVGLRHLTKPQLVYEAAIRGLPTEGSVSQLVEMLRKDLSSPILVSAEAVWQEFGGLEQTTSSYTEVKEEMLDIKVKDIMESERLRDERIIELLQASGNHECVPMKVTIKEEQTDDYFENVQEPEFVSVKEEIHPQEFVAIEESKTDTFCEASLLKNHLSDNTDNDHENEGEETDQPANNARDLNDDSERCPHKQNEYDTAKYAVKVGRKRRGRKPQRDRQTSDRPFQCKICQKCFRKPEHLRCHEMFHSDERPFLCDSCGKRFVTGGDLRRHNVVHTGEKPYACSMCSKAFTQLCNMQAHLRNRCQPKRFGCNLCNRMFENQDELERHKINHGKVKYYKKRNRKHKLICQDAPPFFCDMCSMSFSFKQDLITHVRMHNRTHIVICEVCGKDCVRRGRLIVHMRSHTGEKPFSCSLCGKAFSQKCNMKKHQVLHLSD